MKNYRYRIKTRINATNSSNQCRTTYRIVQSALNYFKENNIVFKESEYCPNWTNEICLKDKVDMLLFLILFGEDWSRV